MTKNKVFWHDIVPHEQDAAIPSCAYLNHWKRDQKLGADNTPLLVLACGFPQTAIQKYMEQLAQTFERSVRVYATDNLGFCKKSLADPETHFECALINADTDYRTITGPAHPGVGIRPAMVVAGSASAPDLSLPGRPNLPNEFAVTDSDLSANLPEKLVEYIRFHLRARTHAAWVELRKMAGYSYINTVMDGLDAAARTSIGEKSKVLILGKAGTGKELVAKALHAQDRYSGGKACTDTFIAFSSMELGSGTLRGQLFGVDQCMEEANTEGLISKAERGTVFFDELHNVDKEAQSLLLRFLQEGTILPIGGEPRHVEDIRLVFGTNRNIQAMYQEGHYAHDFIGRLDELVFQIPNLADIAKENLGELQLFIDQAMNMQSMGVVLNKQPQDCISPQLNMKLISIASHNGFNNNMRDLLSIMKKLQGRLPSSSPLTVSDLQAVLLMAIKGYEYQQWFDSENPPQEADCKTLELFTDKNDKQEATAAPYMRLV